MDGSLAIEDNRAALKRIVAQLVEMAGMAEPATSPSMGEVATQSQEGARDGDAQGGQSENVAAAPPDPLTASLRSAPLPLKRGEEGRPSLQPPAPLPRRSGERWSAKPIGVGVDCAICDCPA